MHTCVLNLCKTKPVEYNQLIIYLHVFVFQYGQHLICRAFQYILRYVSKVGGQHGQQRIVGVPCLLGARAVQLQ